LQKSQPPTHKQKFRQKTIFPQVKIAPPENPAESGKNLTAVSAVSTSSAVLLKNFPNGLSFPFILTADVSADLPNRPVALLTLVAKASRRVG